MIDVTFERSPWEICADSLKQGQTFSAVRFLTLLEREDEASVEEAFEVLRQKRIALDLADLPMSYGSGDLEQQLRREEALVKSGNLLENLAEGEPLRAYLEEIAMIPAAGDPELLALQYVEGDESAAQRLSDLCMSRVVEAAGKLTGRGVLLMDLIQEGSLGLWEGILAYSEGEFLPHIDWWIRQGMVQAVVLQSRSGGVLDTIRKNMEAFREADQRLLTQLGRNPTLEEIALELGISPEEAEVLQDLIRSAREMERVTRVPEKHEDEEEEAVEDTAAFKARRRVLDMLSGLNEQEAKVVTLRFGLESGKPLTAQETGLKLGMTAEEVVALETAALIKMRKEEENS